MLVNLIRFLLVGIILGGTGLSIFAAWSLENRIPVVRYSDFLTELENNEVREVTLLGKKLEVIDSSGRKFVTYIPDADSILPKLVEKKVSISVVPEKTLLFYLGLMATGMIASFFLASFIFRTKESTKREVSRFAKGKIKIVPPEKRVTFEDVAGIPEAKEELKEIVDFLKNPQAVSRLGGRLPRGVLLQGPPGTGKTLLGRAIAGEAGVPFFSISGSDFVEMFVGVGASRVRELFREAKKKAPCIVFIDEIDAVGRHRGSGGSLGGQDEREQTLNALLVEMDGFESEDSVIILAATNRPDVLDPALLRPGRFDRQITILPPNVKGRLKILQLYTRKVVVDESLDLMEIARGTPGFTGADLANLVNEAALMAARKGKERIDLRDFEEAKDKIMLGVEQKGLVVTEKDRKIAAYHEVGHAIVAKMLPDADPLHKITIIPRGRAMGATQQLSLNDRSVYTKEYLQGRIKILLAGRAAEELVLNKWTTAAQDDLLRATEIATKMVCEFGMSEALGPLSYAKENDEFLGGHTSFKFRSEETARLMDKEIKELVTRCYEEAKGILKKEKFFLHKLADILLIEETMDNEEIDIIFECAQKVKGQKDIQMSDACATCSAAKWCEKALSRGTTTDH